MKRRVSILGGSRWLLLLLLVASPATGGDADDEEHFIVDVQGKASVKRKRWKRASAAVPAVYGMKLYPGDLLTLEPEARLTVVCGDATRFILTETDPVPCLTEGKQRKLHHSRAPSEQVPTILSPRATNVRHARPLLRWTAVPGASGYTLVLRDAESLEKYWSADVDAKKMEFAYPDTAPALHPGRTYNLEITAHKPGKAGGKPSSDSTAFTVLAPEAVAALQRRESRLRALGLPEATNRLLLASLYARHELFAEALALLPEKSQVAPEQRLSSSIYLRIGLPRLAEPHAKSAHELAVKAEDVAGRLEAEEALGQIYRVLGAQTEWPQWLKGALKGYQELGDEAKVATLKEQLGGRQ